MIRVCMVCLGNICRSPTAEAAMRHLVAAEGLAKAISIESAGTGSWHVGEPPDERAQEAGRRRGIVVEGEARQFRARDFERFDLVIAMDLTNRDSLVKLAPNEQARAKVHLLRSFDPASARDLDVPDPYYGGRDGFDRVFDICEAGCRGLLDHVRERHGL